MSLPAITDEKLQDYLGVWDKLMTQGHKATLDVTLTEEYGVTWPWPWQRRYTLVYGEERRELTFAQALRVHTWMLATREAKDGSITVKRFYEEPKS